MRHIYPTLIAMFVASVLIMIEPKLLILAILAVPVIALVRLSNRPIRRIR